MKKVRKKKKKTVMKPTVEKITTKEQLDAAFHIREQVFVVEQEVAAEEDRFGFRRDASSFLEEEECPGRGRGGEEGPY